MKYQIKPSNQFKKDLKLAKKQNLNIQHMLEVIDILADGKPLSAKYYDHSLSGNFIGCRECHLAPDWLLIYEYNNDELIFIPDKNRVS